jgi:hypothetical protein
VQTSKKLAAAVPPTTGTTITVFAQTQIMSEEDENELLDSPRSALS